MYKRGQDHFNHGQFKSAFEEFSQCYALSPRPLLLYDMGLTALRLEKYDTALDLLRRFLSTMDKPTPERNTAEALVARLQASGSRGDPGTPTPPLSEPASPTAVSPTPASPTPASPTAVSSTPASPTPTPVVDGALTATAASPSLTAPPTLTQQAAPPPRRRGLILGLSIGAAAVVVGAVAIGIVFGTERGPTTTIGSGHLQ